MGGYIEKVSPLPTSEKPSPELLLAQTRLLWEQTFAELKELPSQEFQMLPTGIGKAPGKNSECTPKVFRDGSRVPFYVDLRERFGGVPHVLFLTGSPVHGEDITGLVALAQEYKAQGVKTIISILTAMPHERQDHKFTDPVDGSRMKQVVTLQASVRGIAGWHLCVEDSGHATFQKSIDGCIVVQPHSPYLMHYGLQEGIPMLPLDALELLYTSANLREVENPFVLGPDKGRVTQADLLARFLGCEDNVAHASKTRDRKGDGKPTVSIPEIALNRMRDKQMTLIVGDDEIREAGTMGDIACCVSEYVDKMIICSPKLICAGDAVEKLSPPVIDQIITTDAIFPLTDVSSIANKLRVVRLEPEIEKIVDYLRSGHIVDPGNNEWLHSSQTGTLLRVGI